jgi:hypothetical protein
MEPVKKHQTPPRRRMINIKRQNKMNFTSILKLGNLKSRNTIQSCEMEHTNKLLGAE